MARATGLPVQASLLARVRGGRVAHGNLSPDEVSHARSPHRAFRGFTEPSPGRLWRFRLKLISSGWP